MFRPIFDHLQYNILEAIKNWSKRSKTGAREGLGMRLGKLPGNNSENHDVRGERGQSGGKRGEKETKENCIIKVTLN